MRKFIIFVISVSMVSLSLCTASPVSNTQVAQAVTIKDYPDGDVISNPFTFHDEETTAGDFEFETTTSNSIPETAGYETTTSDTSTETTGYETTTSETASETAGYETTTSETDNKTTDIENTTSGLENETSTTYTDTYVETPTGLKKSGFDKNGYYKDSKSGAVYKLINKSKKTVKYTGNTKNKLKEAIIPAKITVSGVSYKVTIIGKKALSSKKSLKVIVVGKNVKNIESLAFSKNKKLETVIIGSKKMIKSKKDIFKKSNKNAVIKVPKKYLKKYKRLFKNNTVIKK